MSYGTIISNFRRERLRLKQYELADLMKVNVATLSVIENNYRKPTLKFVEKIAKVGNCHISEVLGYELNKKNN